MGGCLQSAILLDVLCMYVQYKYGVLNCNESAIGEG